MHVYKNYNVNTYQLIYLPNNKKIHIIKILMFENSLQDTKIGDLWDTRDVFLFLFIINLKT
jgi:hypothetical protein